MPPLPKPRSASTRPVKPAGPRAAPVQPVRKEDLEPLYHVILHDDDEHTHRYVVEMLVSIFGYDPAKAFDMACEVNETGAVILATLDQELAKWRVKQILGYGPDPHCQGSKGSMRASMEPAK